MKQLMGLRQPIPAQPPASRQPGQGAAPHLLPRSFIIRKTERIAFPAMWRRAWHLMKAVSWRSRKTLTQQQMQHAPGPASSSM